MQLIHMAVLQIVCMYPFLYKAPVLMPVMWIVRLICAPVTKMDRIRKEVGFWRKMGKKE